MVSLREPTYSIPHISLPFVISARMVDTSTMITSVIAVQCDGSVYLKLLEELFDAVEDVNEFVLAGDIFGHPENSVSKCFSRKPRRSLIERSTPIPGKIILAGLLVGTPEKQRLDRKLSRGNILIFTSPIQLEHPRQRRQQRLVEAFMVGLHFVSPSSPFLGLIGRGLLSKVGEGHGILGGAQG